MNQRELMHRNRKSQIAPTSDKVALVSCSNGLPEQMRPQVEVLVRQLQSMGLEIVLSPYLYAAESAAGGSARQRAESLMQYYRDSDIGAIYDLSGGDIANEILPYLDYDVIASADKLFWGYSDLTTVINAIYAKTGRSSVLYQVRNVVRDDSGKQKSAFKEYVDSSLQGMWGIDVAKTDMAEGGKSLFQFPYEFIRGDHLQGVVVGGNIRCLLKLAGTPHWPNMTDKVLLLESRSGGVPQMTTYLSQLQQMGVFDQIQGILLGTFTQMEREQAQPDITELVRGFAGEEMPIVKTAWIGHGADSKAIWIGAEISLNK